MAITLTAGAILLAGSCSALLLRQDTPPDHEVGSELGPWRPGMSLRETFRTFPPATSGPVRLRLLAGNVEAWTERWRMLASAERTIDVSAFILHEDVFGVAFLGHVLAKARQGVRVRILLDAMGTKMSWSPRGNDYFDELANDPHVEMKTYRPLWNRYVEGLLMLSVARVAASEHDKILVIDGARAMTGGRNVGSEYFTEPSAERRAFLDLDVRLDGPEVAASLTRAFDRQFASEHAAPQRGEIVNVRARDDELLLAHAAMDHWLRGADPKPDLVRRLAGTSFVQELARYPLLRGALHDPPPRPLRAEVRILDSGVRLYDPRDPITAALGRVLGAARRDVLIQSPYLVLSEDGARLLEEAGRRGVRVTIVTNSPVSSDNALSQAFFLEQWPELLARVPHLRIFVAGNEHTLHAKAITVDGQLALIGTYNLDPTSMALNSELMAAVWSRAFAAAVTDRARAMVAHGAPAVYEYTIVRDATGAPVRAESGKPRIAFGPRDHCDPERWTALGILWASLRTARDFTGFSPLL